MCHISAVYFLGSRCISEGFAAFSSRQGKAGLQLYSISVHVAHIYYWTAGIGIRFVCIVHTVWFLCAVWYSLDCYAYLDSYPAYDILLHKDARILL